RRAAAKRRQQQARGARAHRELGAERRESHPAGKAPPPERGVLPRERRVRRARVLVLEERRTMRVEHCGKQPGGLQRHADPLAEQRVRFAAGVADREAAPLAPERPPPRPNRTDREPPAYPLRAAQCATNAEAARAEPALYGVTRALASYRAAATRERVAADTAGEREQAAVGDDHAAIAARQRQHRQE